MATSPLTRNDVPQAAAFLPANGGQAVSVGIQPVTRFAVRATGLARLSSGDLQITINEPQFLSIAHDTLGNFGDNTDGFDAIIATPLGALTNDVSTLDDMGQDLLDMDFVEGAFSGDAFTPVANDLVSFTSAGDTALGAFNNTVSPPAPDPGPQPQPQPDPDPHPGIGGHRHNPGIGDPDPGATGSGGGGTERCSIIVDPRTSAVLGTACEDTGAGGGHIHGKLQP